MSLPIGLPAHVKNSAVWLSSVYTSAVTMNVPVQNSVSLYDTWHIQLLRDVYLVNSTRCKLYQKALDMFCLAMPLVYISEDTRTLSITGTGWSAENLMLIHDTLLHYIMAGVWCAMRATRINRVMCVRWVC